MLATILKPRTPPISFRMMTTPGSPRWFGLMALAFLLSGCLLSDTLDATYDDVAEARAAQAIEKGWIPEWVPEHATALREVHNLDTSVSALAFDLPADTRVPVPDGCRHATYAQTLPVPIERAWWPRPEVLASRYTFFTCPAPYTGFEFVGMRRDGRHVLHWRTYGR